MKATPEERARARASEARYRRTNPNWPKKNREAQARWRANNQIKVVAVQALNRAIGKGEIERATSCDVCGTSDVPIQAHHADYTHPLDVEWLCVPCHEAEHHN